MKVLAFIPARAGSKGIPNKNFRKFAGRPLIEWTIEAAINSKHVNRIVLSTDSDEGIRIAGLFDGLDVHRRRPEHATDEAEIEPAIIDCLGIMRERDNYRPDLVVLLQPTSPLRPEGLIDECIDKLIDKQIDSVLTVHKLVKGFEWEWDGLLKGYVCMDERGDRQNRKPKLMENGNVFVTRRPMLESTGFRASGRVELVEIAWQTGLEVDSYLDYWIIEKLLEDVGN